METDESPLSYFSFISSFSKDFSLWEGMVVLKRTVSLWFLVVYALSPRIRLASWMSLGMIVTRFACMAHKFTSSKSPTRYASAASCRALKAWAAILKSCLRSCMSSLTSHLNGACLISSFVLLWYLLISLRATVPGLYLCGFSPSAFLLSAATFFAADKD